LNGQAVEGTKQLDDISTRLRPGDVVIVTVRGSGASNVTTRKLAIVVNREPAQAGQQVFAMLVSASITFATMLIGFYIGFARSRDPLAWIAMAMLAGFGHFAGSGGGWALFWSREIILFYRGILANPGHFGWCSSRSTSLFPLTFFEVGVG
jgi:hypothetical protein